MMNDTKDDRQPAGLAPVHGSARRRENAFKQRNTMQLTVEQLISKLSDIGQTLGFQTPVRVWNTSEASEPFQPVATVQLS